MGGGERTFQRRFGRRTARCSLSRGRGMEEDASAEEAGSEWQERASKEEEREDAAREGMASVVLRVKTRLRAATGDIPSDMTLAASS